MSTGQGQQNWPFGAEEAAEGAGFLRRWGKRRDRQRAKGQSGLPHLHRRQGVCTFQKQTRQTRGPGHQAPRTMVGGGEEDTQ